MNQSTQRTVKYWWGMPWYWQFINLIIIVNFALEIFYGMYQTFFILRPESGQAGPLWGASTEISFELMVARRLYAIETWIAITGLSLYLAIVYREKLKWHLRPEPISDSNIQIKNNEKR